MTLRLKRKILPLPPLMALLGALLVSVCCSARGYVIYYGSHSTATEKAVCYDLQHDLCQLTGDSVSVLREPAAIATGRYAIVVGTPATSRLIASYFQKGLLDTAALPAAGGGLIHVVRDGRSRVLVLTGRDVAGMQHTVYDFSTHDLGIDPLAYWTGYEPRRRPAYDPYRTVQRTVPPPVVPVICYMENDVDELANLHKPYLEYSMDTWKGMVNSLRRMGYNAIQLFDMLGRPEFYTRAPYLKLVPGYRANMKLVDSMIDYAHLKGMRIQVDLSLGYQMRSITDEQALCWTRYRDDWVRTWIYYLTRTPLGKADIYSLRPRNQVWDRAYVSSCGEDKVTVFNDVFRVFDSVLHVYEPGKQKVCVCYDDGMEMFNGGFSPPKDFTVAWSDDGYCSFPEMPASTKGYPFGTYMHAGFWTNHTVHDPYPLRIDSVMTLMRTKYHATSYVEVNGQTFRPFLLNLSAFAAWARDPVHFNGSAFYSRWCSRYFGARAAPFAKASMQALHHAQFGRTGYVRNLGQIKSLTGYLADRNVVSSRGVSYRVSYARLDFPDLQRRRDFLARAVAEAARGTTRAKDQAHFYYDFVCLPAIMYLQLMDFEITLVKTARLKHDYESGGDVSLLDTASALAGSAFRQMRVIDSTCLKGDENNKWASWYDPVKRRPNNGFPTLHAVGQIRAHLDSLRQAARRQ
jgi:hypothetical protein